MRDKEKEMIAWLLLGSFTLHALFSLYWGWVLTFLWKWFIVPLGIPSIGVLHAWGIGLAFGLIQGTKLEHDTEKHDWIGYYVRAIFTPPIALLIGWIIHGYI